MARLVVRVPITGGKADVKRVAKAIRGGEIHRLLVTQAQRRIRGGGDSLHRYPDLWGHPRSRRLGGQPLRDTGRMQQSLASGQRGAGNRITMAIRSPLKHAIAHQTGFKTKGPNFIPLSNKARRKHRKGKNPREEGLVWGEDYVMAWKGVTVDQRKIFNTPPEDVREIARAIRDSIARHLR